MMKVSKYLLNSWLVLIISLSFSTISNGQTYFSEPIVTEDVELIKDAKKRFNETSKIASKKYPQKVFNLYYKNSLERVRGFREMVESGHLLYSGELFDEVNSLFEQIKAFNPELDSSMRMFIYRTDEPNAFSTGDGMIFINLGLIYRCQNQEQLAWVIAHEIAHDELKHFELKIIDYSELLLSKEINDELKKLKRAKYHKATAFYELMLPQLLTRSSNSRSYERQADSLGSVYFKRTIWKLNEALGVFPVLESFDDEIWSTPLDFGHFFNENYVEAISKRIQDKQKPSPFDMFKTAEPEDSIAEFNLRTHPFPMERYNLMLEWNNIDSLDVISDQSEEYQHVKNMTRHEIIAHLMRTDQMDKALYYSLRYLQIDPTSEFEIRVVSYVLGLTCFARDRNMMNTYISVKSRYEGDNFNAFTEFLMGCDLTDLKTLNANWQEQYSAILSTDKWGVSIALNGLIERNYQQFDAGLSIQQRQNEQDLLFYSLLSSFGESLKSVRLYDENK